MVGTNHGESRNNNSRNDWRCGACGQPYDWRKLDRLLTLQMGDRAQEQVVFLVYGVPDGERDSLICALNLVTNLTKESELGIVVQNRLRAVKIGLHKH